MSKARYMQDQVQSLKPYDLLSPPGGARAHTRPTRQYPVVTGVEGYSTLSEALLDDAH